MKNLSHSPFAKGLCLFALAIALCKPAAAADISSESNDQLISRLQATMAANPNTKARGNFAEGIALAVTQGDYVTLERALMQLKMQLSSDPEAVSVIELLLARYQAAEAAAAAKRSAEVNAIVKDLTDKFNAHAPAPDYDELLKRISDLATASASVYGGRETIGSQRIEDARAFAAGWQEYLVASAQENPQQAAAQLGQLIQLTSHFTAIPRSTLLSLQVAPGAATPASIAKEKDEKEKTQQFAVKFVAQIDAAKVPADLDSVLAEEGPTNRYGAQSFQGFSTKAFVRKWQDYLAAVQAGKVLEAQKVLQELSANSDSTFYPRSKILARMASLGAAAGIRGISGLLMDPAALTLDNLRAFLAQIDALGDANFLYEHGEANLRTAVGHLAAAVSQFRAGDAASGALVLKTYGASAFTPEQVGEYSQALTRLYEQLAVTALPSYIDIPADLKPLPQERLAPYLDRVMKGAVAAKDWHLALRVSQVRGQIGPAAGYPDAVMADHVAFQAMVTAGDKEDASLWAEAVSGYMSALGATSPFLPVKEIGNRLARIKAEHPDEYAKGASMPDYPSLLSRLLETQRSGFQAPANPKPWNPSTGIPGQVPTDRMQAGGTPAGPGRPGPQAVPSN